MPDFLEDQTPVRLSVVIPPSVPSGTPQFSTAEYAHIPGTERCRICSNLVSGEYYRVNGQMACATCAGQATAGQPTDSHAAFARSVLFGIGGAIVGLALYCAVTQTFNFSIGYLALAVGWLVGKAMIKGSNGLGGRRYQIVAVVLTYAAISLSPVPVILYYVSKRASTITDWGAVLQRVALWGIASPFLRLTKTPFAVIGLIILFVGLRIAWQLTAARPLAVDGPYPVSTT